jgi:hypothetical protein
MYKLVDWSHLTEVATAARANATFDADALLKEV